MTTKFTPGPWSVTGDNSYIFSWKSLDKGGMPRPICGPAIIPSEHEENVANAHLISAAPELYEALEKIVQDVQQTSTGGITGPGYWEALDEAREALAKARGEA